MFDATSYSCENFLRRIKFVWAAMALAVFFFALAGSASAQLTTLNFGTWGVGNTSTPLGVGICNAGGGDLLIFTVSIDNPSEFKLVGDSCSGADLTAFCSNSCAVSAEFTPDGVGTETGNIDFTSNVGPFTVALIGVGSNSIPNFMSAQDKADAEATAIAFDEINAFFLGLAESPLCIATPGCEEAADAMVLISAAAALSYHQLAQDPPDSNFTVIPQPNFPPVPQLMGTGLNQAQSAAASAILANLVQEIGYARALVVANNRAQGAAIAGNAFWQQQQFAAASLYAAKLAILISGEAGLRMRFQSALGTSGVATLQITPAMVAAFTTSLSGSGLPSWLVGQLQTLGFGTSDISNLQTALSAVVLDKPISFSNLLSQPTATTESQVSGDLMRDAAKYASRYTFGGFLPPLMPNMTAKSGRTLPVKFQLFSSNGTIVSNALASVGVFPSTNGSSLPTPIVQASGKSNVSDLFRFDQTSQQYIYNLDTRGYAPGGYTVRVTLDDTSTHDVQIMIN